MELSYKELVGIVTILMVVYAYYKYIYDILKGETRPHFYTWLLFFLLSTTIFLIQYEHGAGSGARASASLLITNIVILILSLKYGEKNRSKFDNIALILGCIGLFLYIFLESAVYSFWVMVAVLLLAFYPTFQKSWIKPYSETPILYSMAALRMFIGIVAINEYSFFTYGFPLIAGVVNLVLVCVIRLRRKTLFKG